MTSALARLAGANWPGLALLMALGFTPVVSAEPSLPAARDLRADARSAERVGVPLIVMVSLAGCPHCEVVRRSHLLPLLRAAAAAPKPVIRQVEINGGGFLRDFAGKEITHAQFAKNYSVRIAPVVFFFNAKGELLSGPLIGAMIPDFYGAYFDAALSEAQSKVRPPSEPGRPE